MNLFGRPRRIPAICSSDEWQREAAERKLISTAVQGGAADLVKRAMVYTHEYCQSQPYGKADMVLMVHDDLQFDVSYEGSARIVRDLKHIMETSSSDIIQLPIIADVEYFTTNWANKKSFTGRGW